MRPLRHRHLRARDRHRGLPRSYPHQPHRAPAAHRARLRGENLLVWTTTPWTLTSNVAAAVHPEPDLPEGAAGDQVYYLAEGAAKTALRGRYETLAEVKGADLLDLTYSGPFDELPAAQGVRHRVIAWKDVSAEEGTGIVHIAPGCGKEDFALSKEYGLDVIAPIDDSGYYLEGFDWLTGAEVHAVARAIAENLQGKGVLYREEQYTHRYPTCWRCGEDLVFRLVDEWFIAMDPLREPLMRISEQIRWIPSFGLDRELDWLRNMDDWMISKKRYWGLALPIYECHACGNFDVIGSETELKDRAVAGWDEFEGHTPHRPWVDAVKIACSKCGQQSSRIPDVGNPWLDAGIVGFSTLGYRQDPDHWREWYPADFITESFPGQFRNWFYALLAESTVLVNEPPFKTVLGYGLLRDETGREMHKSWGNAIEFDEGAERMGVDVMRWLYMTGNPSTNLNFGYNLGDEVRRRFILPLWNSYSFWVTYARLDGWDPRAPRVPVAERAPLDRWVLAKLNELVAGLRDRLGDYDAQGATRLAEAFVVDDLSNWYIRRSRPRFWRTTDDADKAGAHATLYEVLTTLATLLAPIIPYLTDEMYQNLVRSVYPDAPESVHLCDYPSYDPALADAALLRDMATVINVVELGRAARTKAELRVRQPLAKLLYHAPQGGAVDGGLGTLAEQVLDELNVKAVEPMARPEDFVTYEIRPNLPLIGKKYGKQVPLIRQYLATADAAAIARDAANGTGATLALPDGTTVTLAPEELLIDARQREGFAIAEGNGYVVALDTELTPELRQEGLARDFVRVVQEARKSAGLRIEDHIRVTYAAAQDGEVAAAVAAHAAFIAGETLADTLAPGDPAADAYREDVTLGGESVTLGLVRVGA
ncbi:MAG: class I tRNA ligase family protein [Thermomicrobiales bacterium]